jgi:beta-fructofuranosidase
MTAVSPDLIGAGPSTVVIGERPPLPGFGRDLRDPYVFKGPDGLWKMVLGGHDDGAALVLLYETDDLGAACDWRFAGVLHREPLPRAVPAECPCVIALDGEGDGLHALVFGLIGRRSLVKGRLNPSFALVGRFDGTHFEEVARRELDFIGDCYGFQGFSTWNGPAGLAWAANWADVRRSQDFPSAMTFVRRLVWQDGALLMPPVDAVAELRRQLLASSIEELRRGVELPDGLAEISFEVAGGAPFRLTLSHSDRPMVLEGSGSTLELIADWALPRARGVRHVAATGPVRRVRVFVDVGLIEIYADGGRWCGTKRVDSDRPVTAAQLDAESVGQAEVWQLRPQTGAYR